MDGWTGGRGTSEAESLAGGLTGRFKLRYFGGFLILTD